jgi:hypothetical protein
MLGYCYTLWFSDCFVLLHIALPLLLKTNSLIVSYHRASAHSPHFALETIHRKRIVGRCSLFKWFAASLQQSFFTLFHTCRLLPRRSLTNRLPPRFGPSSLHQRDPRSALFEGYDGGATDRTRKDSSSPARPSYGVGYAYPGVVNGPGNAGLGVERPSYRPATPNSRHVAPPN